MIIIVNICVISVVVIVIVCRQKQSSVVAPYAYGHAGVLQPLQSAARGRGGRAAGLPGPA